MAGVGEGGWGKMHTIEQLKKDKKNNISVFINNYKTNIINLAKE